MLNIAKNITETTASYKGTVFQNISWFYFIFESVIPNDFGMSLIIFWRMV